MNVKKEITEKENMQMVFDGIEPAWLPSYGDACARMLTPTLQRKRDSHTGYDIDPFGVAFTNTPDGAIPVNTHTNVFELTDITKWKDVMPQINLKEIDWENEAMRIRATRVKEGQMIDYTAGYVWEQLHYLMGFENALMSLLLEPEAAIEALNAFADFWIEVMRYQYKYLKPDMITFMEHMATAKGTLMSPDTYREIIKPVHKKMFAAVIDLGAIPVIHVDGHIEELIPDFVEIGVKAIQPFQVFNDINTAKDKYSLVAIGGWDAFGNGNQSDSTEADVRESVRLAMDTYGPGGRYIFWGSGITPRFKENSQYMADEARIYGHNFYKKHI